MEINREKSRLQFIIITFRSEEVRTNKVEKHLLESFNAKDDARIKNEEYLYSSCQTNLNFSTANCSEDDYSEYGVYKNKNKITRQDPKSHRIIEKRRRDRMNNCLADLSRLIPPEYLKKGRGRVEKTEIIEMAIKHMKYLQQDQISPCERYRLGYQECMSETMRFMVEVEGHFPREGLCMRLLNHLQKHCEVIRRSPQVEIKDADEERHLSEYKCRNGSGDLSPNDYRDTLNKSHQDSADLRGVGQSRLLPSAVLNNTSDSDIYHMEPNGYKYKTNIKLRFSQDLVIGQQTKRPCPEVSARRSSVNSSENQISTHTSPMTSELLPPSSEHASDSGYLPLHRIIRPPNFPVPVFALHAKGSFYVPLTVDYHALLPFLRLHQCDLMLDALPASSSLVLHPVTISVDFRPRGCASEGGSSRFEGSNGSEGKCKTECGGWR